MTVTIHALFSLSEDKAIWNINIRKIATSTIIVVLGVHDAAVMTRTENSTPPGDLTTHGYGLRST